MVGHLAYRKYFCEQLLTQASDNESIHFQKHHVSFDKAKRVINASDKRIFKDTKPNLYNEERFIIGTVDKRMLFVVYTKMNNEIVIISARRLAKRQQESHRYEYSKT